MNSGNVKSDDNVYNQQNDSTKIEILDNEKHCIGERPSEIPNGGWGWVVLLSALVIRIICCGIMVSFGLFLKPLVEEYHTSQSTMSWLPSIISALHLGAAPLASFLSQKFSHRMIVIIGTSLSGLLFALPYFYSPLWFLFFSAIVTGMGMGVALMSTTVVLTTYFDTRRSTVLGIFTSGTGLASFIMTPFLEYLINKYDWRVAMLTYGMLFSICGTVAMTFISIENKKEIIYLDYHKSLNTEKSTLISDYVLFDTGQVPLRRINSFANYGAFEMTDEEIDNVFLNSSLQIENEKVEKTKLSEKSRSLMNLPFSSLFLFKDQIVLNNTNSDDNDVDDEDDESKRDEIDIESELLKPETKKLGYLQLLTNKIFLLFLIVNLLANMGKDTPSVYGKQLAIDRGISAHNAIYLLTAIGLGNTFGRLFFGFFGSKKIINSYILYWASMIICGIFLLFSRLAYNFPLMLVYTIGFGVFLGSYFTLTSTVIIDILGIDNFPKALSMIYFVQAVGLLIGTPISGFIYDQTKSLTWSFMNSGILIFVSGLILLLAYLSREFRKS